jgi:PqqD family protein of HPr-rel-A system
MSKAFKLADHVVCRKTDSDLCMLFDQSKGVMYELNETASSIIEALGKQSQTIDQIIGTLADDYEAQVDEIRDDVGRLLGDFENAGLLVAI